MHLELFFGKYVGLCLDSFSLPVDTYDFTMSLATIPNISVLAFGELCSLSGMLLEQI